MLWSLLKVLLFVAIIAALTFGASHLLSAGEGIRIIFGDTEFSIGLLQAVILSLLGLVGAWVLFKIVGLAVALFRFLNGDETAMSRYLDRSREKRGYEALADGILALTAGEGRLAINKSVRAEKFLNRPELTDLVIAQAAEMVGDSKRATEAWKRRLDDDRTRFVALRGLMRMKLAEGDTDTALKLAEHALAIRPRHGETQDVLLKLQADRGDWKGARRTLEAKQRSGNMPRDVYKRRDAVLALQEAKEVFAEGNSIEAREAAIAANRQSPDLIPAAVMAARGYLTTGDRKSASRVLRKAWEVSPHPDLAAAFAEIEPNETPAQRLKRFDTLLRLRPDDEQTRLLRAELNIAAEDFPAARRAMGDLAETHPTARSLAIMAAIERGEGADDAVVRGWLARALVSPRGPQWVCDNCGAIHAQWGPICDNCGAFDTLTWKEPPEGAGPSPTQAEMLPLIVRAPEPKSAPVAPVAEPEPEPVPESVTIAPDETPEPVVETPPLPVEPQEPQPASSSPFHTPRAVDLDAMRKAGG
ncbi:MULTISPECIES: heme biosynthesis protein HemY [Haematobacter]|uniref:Heme biosynthesis protein HemY n=1 Tax=Haematobacter genomosp. 1 TaxID=366618 RepID=A0A212AGT8_9RHOB|nr:MULTISPECIES: heme biosynthesis HemY N-terminal domain-containing protein [Haematobacter]OWJ80655.1 heme biosynthesis protein HemY [Haematobacter genomosp. 1]